MNPSKQFAKYVTSSVLGMLGLSCYILADTYFISAGIGELGLAALNIAIPIFNLISGIGLMTGVGAASRFSAYRKTSAQTSFFPTPAPSALRPGSFSPSAAPCSLKSSAFCSAPTEKRSP